MMTPLRPAAMIKVQQVYLCKSLLPPPLLPLPLRKKRNLAQLLKLLPPPLLLPPLKRRTTPALPPLKSYKPAPFSMLVFLSPPFSGLLVKPLMSKLIAKRDTLKAWYTASKLHCHTTLLLLTSHILYQSRLIYQF